MMPETPQKGVCFASFSARFWHGSLVHTGGVTGSIPVSPTTVFLGSLRLQHRKRERPMVQETPGYVYIFAIVEEETGQVVKIGFAKNPEARLASLQTGSPRAITRVAVYPGSPDDERWLHKKLAHLRVRGEWFRYTDEIDDLVYDAQDGRTILRLKHGPDYHPSIRECLEVEGAQDAVNEILAAGFGRLVAKEKAA